MQSERAPSTRGGRGQCAACAHGDQVTINSELAAGSSLRSLSARFGISRPALRAHKTNHLSPALVALHKAEGAETVLEQLRDLVSRARRFLETAEVMGNSSQGLAAIRELRETLMVVARATGELEPTRAVTAIDIQRSAEWGAIRTVVLDVLRGHPQLKLELSERLLLLDKLVDKAPTNGHVDQGKSGTDQVQPILDSQGGFN